MMNNHPSRTSTAEYDIWNEFTALVHCTAKFIFYVS